MSRHEREERGSEQQRNTQDQGHTTYPPTPGDRNEAARAERKFGLPAAAEGQSKGDQEAESNRAS